MENLTHPICFSWIGPYSSNRPFGCHLPHQRLRCLKHRQYYFLFAFGKAQAHSSSDRHLRTRRRRLYWWTFAVVAAFSFELQVSWIDLLDLRRLQILDRSCSSLIFWLAKMASLTHFVYDFSSYSYSVDMHQWDHYNQSLRSERYHSNCFPSASCSILVAHSLCHLPPHFHLTMKMCVDSAFIRVTFLR